VHQKLDRPPSSTTRHKHQPLLGGVAKNVLAFDPHNQYNHAIDTPVHVPAAQAAPIPLRPKNSPSTASATNPGLCRASEAPTLRARTVSKHIHLKTSTTTATVPPKITETPIPPSNCSFPKSRAINEIYEAGKLDKVTPSSNTRYWQNNYLVDQPISNPDIGKTQSPLTNARPED
jgi:hypothetical protein